MIRKILLIALLLSFCISVIGCQTVQGIGGDIKWTGEKSEEILEGGQ
ncbi:MAG: hypothetical protein JW804_02200 [Sedimentisphaerales bacterium]|nr:hypothetical protein [Sedimentisphaerales bacterium]